MHNRMPVTPRHVISLHKRKRTGIEILTGTEGPLRALRLSRERSALCRDGGTQVLLLFIWSRTESHPVWTLIFLKSTEVSL